MQGKQVAVLDELDNQLIMIIKNIHQIDDSVIYKLEMFEKPEIALEFNKRFEDFVRAERDYYEAPFLRESSSYEAKFLSLFQFMEENLKGKQSELYTYQVAFTRALGIRIKIIETYGKISRGFFGSEINELDKKLDKLLETLEKITILSEFKGIEMFVQIMKLELDTLKAFVQVQKSMEHLNLSSCLINISRFKIALSQWSDLIIRLSVEQKDGNTRKLFQYLRRYLSFSTSKCELYFMEFLSKPLQYCSLKPKTSMSNGSNGLQQTNRIVEMLQSFETSNPDVKCFIIAKEPVIQNPFFESDELSPSKNRDYVNIYVVNKLVVVYGVNRNSSDESRQYAQGICELIEDSYEKLELFPVEKIAKAEKTSLKYYIEKIDFKAYAAVCAVNCLGKKFEKCFMNELPLLLKALKGSFEL